MEKDKIIELCDQIKAKMVEKGLNAIILRIADTNDYVDVDEETKEALNECWDGDCSIQAVNFECGDYIRTLRVDGVYIEDNTLRFYISDVEMSDDGDEDMETIDVDLDELLDDGAWWNQSEDFYMVYVLKHYLGFIDYEGDECFGDYYEKATNIR